MRCSSLLRLLEDGGSDARAALSRSYGPRVPGGLDERSNAWVCVLRRFHTCWGDREVHLLRAPARISFNPHCEHQGAWVPYGTHRREIICVAGARPDDVVTLTNLDPSHTNPVSFSLHGEIAVAPAAWRQGWVDYIEDPEVARRREALADPKERECGRTGSINLAKAAALRLMMEAAAPPTGARFLSSRPAAPAAPGSCPLRQRTPARVPCRSARSGATRSPGFHGSGADPRRSPECLDLGSTA